MSRIKYYESHKHGTIAALAKGRALPPEGLFVRLWHGVVKPVEAAYSEHLYAGFHKQQPHAFPDVDAIIDGKADRLKHYDELTIINGLGIISSTRQQAMVIHELLRRLREIFEEAEEEARAKNVRHFNKKWYDSFNPALTWAFDNLRLDMAAYFVGRASKVHKFEMVPSQLPDGLFAGFMERMDEAVGHTWPLGDTDRKDPAVPPTSEQREASRILMTVIKDGSRTEFDPGADLDCRMAASEVLKSEPPAKGI